MPKSVGGTLGPDGKIRAGEVMSNCNKGVCNAPAGPVTYRACNGVCNECPPRLFYLPFTNPEYFISQTSVLHISSCVLSMLYQLYPCEAKWLQSLTWLNDYHVDRCAGGRCCGRGRGCGRRGA